MNLGVKGDLKQEIFNEVNENVRALERLFPSAVKDGQVDFEALKEELGQFEEVGPEKYGLTWSGKQNAKKIAQQDIVGKTLKYIPEDSKNPETTENLYIEGDNLEVLKLLRQNYYGAIKMIYIDPPYNTGNDFVYNDNFKKSKDESDIEEGDVSDLGERYTVNTKSSNKYHAKWLNMMYPRLKIAKDLLKEDGVIFISIDDNEAMNLKKICDEIFGSENLVEIFYNQVRYSNKSLTEKDNFQKLIEQTLIYKKNIFIPNRPFEEYSLEKFCFNIEEIGNGENVILGGKNVRIFKPHEYKIHKVEPSIDGLKETWASGTVLKGNASGKYFDKYLSSRVDIDGLGVLYKVDGIGEDGLGYRYFTGPKKLGATKGKFYSGVPLERVKEIKKGFSRKFKPINNYEDYSASFGNIRQEGGVDFRSGKKPIKMLKKYIGLATNNADSDIILDFFSGSSSTAHAVMELNLEDNTKRKFIMVQLQELTDKDSDYYRAGFVNICEIGKERIRRAGEKIKEENKDKEGIEDLDIGFKVFRVGDTNIRWNYENEDLKTLSNEVTIKSKEEQTTFDFIAATKSQVTLDETVSAKDRLDFMPGAKDIDIVYEILLRQRDIPLSAKVELLEDIGKRTYIFADSYLVCLEENITVELIEKLAERNPLPIKFILRDSAFGDDIALKDEAYRRLKALIERNSGESKKTYTVEFI